jgi:curved DNA-binding protein CbpA
MKDYYEILGIEKTATLAEIKKVFRELAKKYHPDMNGNDPTYEALMKEINEAYATLSDAKKRKEYDSKYSSNQGPTQSGYGSNSGKNSHYADSSDNSDEFIDFSSEREESGIDYHTLINHSDSIPEQFEDLLKQIILLPNPDIQIPVLVSYAFTPSALANNLPIGVCYGSSGSGKSETLKLIAALRNSAINTAASTFASIRNSIENSRWYDSDKTFEKNFLLIWDDINENVFLSDDKLFSLFKSGINRKATITIADKMGVNMEFKPFSPKLCSTVTPFWDNPKLVELKRRVLPFLFKQIPVSLGDNNDPEYDTEFNLLTVEEVNFNGLNGDYERFWRVKENRTQFNKAKGLLSKIKTHSIPLEVYRLNLDVMATTALIYGLNSRDTVTIWENYYSYIIENIFDSNVGILRIFTEWLNSQEAEFIELQRMKGSNNLVLKVKPLDALNYLETCYINSEISQKPERGIIEGFFVSKGYIKQKTQQGYHWIKNLSTGGN